jgi:Aspartyl protease
MNPICSHLLPLDVHSFDGHQGELFALDKDFSTLDECIDDARNSSDELFHIASIIRGQRKPAKRQKIQDLKPIVYVRFNTRHGKPKPVTLRALLDSGGSGTLVTERYAKKLRLVKSKTANTVWTTPGGALQTTTKCKSQFTIPELHDNRLIEWDVHITKTLGAYDMIIGRDVLTDLGIDIRFSNHTIEWDNSEIPMKDIDATFEDSFFVGDSDHAEDAMERIKSILDAKYEKANLYEVAKEAVHLGQDEQRKLQDLLEKYESLFDGTLGHWDDVECKVELKPDVQPYHARAYPIPHKYVDTLKLEVERLCEIGVLKRVNRSEWAAPTFIVPKKDGSVRFISDF